MTNEPLYHKTVGILVDAYFNDTLQPINCRACAVTNMIAASTGVSFVKTGNMHQGLNGYIIDRVEPSENVDYLISWYKKGFTKCEIDWENVVGYSSTVMEKIEDVFIHAEPGKSHDEYVFNGLMAIVDYLDEIHDNKDESVTATSKQRFQKSNLCVISS